MPFVDYKKVHRDPDLQELNTRSLREILRKGVLEPARQREYATEAALRSAGAVAPFALFWIACPLGLRLERRSRALGVGLGRRSLGLSAWGPWIPDAASLIAGLPLWLKLGRV